MSQPQPIKCANCTNTLRQGEIVLCAPCFQVAAASRSSQETPTRQRPPTSKVVAAVQHVHNITNPQHLPSSSRHLPTGDNRYQQLHNKAIRDSNRQLIGKKRTQNGYGAAPKPPPFQKLGISTNSHIGGASISLGFHILFDSTFRPLASNPHQQFRALIAVDLTHNHLADFIIKKALLQWPPASTHPPENEYPRPPSNYSWDEDLRSRFFKLGKIPAGASKNKIISVFGDPNLEEQNNLISTSISNYRGRAGDCPLEVVFDADCFYDHHPEITRPNIRETSILSATPRKKRRKQTLTDSEIALDDDDSLPEGVDVIGPPRNPKRQKTTNLPTRHANPKPSEPIPSTSQPRFPSIPRTLNSTQQQRQLQKTHLSQHLQPASSTTIYLDVDADEAKSQTNNMPRIEETYVLPGRASSKCSSNLYLFHITNSFAFPDPQLPLDPNFNISKFGRPIANALRPGAQLFNSSENLIMGKRRVLQVQDGSPDPVWVNYLYWFKVNKENLLGQGSFRKCYEAVGQKMKERPLDQMVAKCLKHREAKKGCNKLPKYDDMGQLYAGFNHLLLLFKKTSLAIPEVTQMAHWRRRLEALRVQYFDPSMLI